MFVTLEGNRYQRPQLLDKDLGEISSLSLINLAVTPTQDPDQGPISSRYDHCVFQSIEGPACRRLLSIVLRQAIESNPVNEAPSMKPNVGFSR